MSKKNYKDPYFQHDRYARQDPKIKAMLTHFRKENENKAKAAVCLYWWIVEDMHTDDYPLSKLEVFADDYRCDVDFLKSILEDFGLFHIDEENSCYVSDRVLRNLKEQHEKSEKAKKSANKRWHGQPKQDMTKDEIDFVNEVIQKFNSYFKKSQIVSKENREKINDITKENNLTLEIWDRVFKNAKRGWDFGERKNVKPMLKNILSEWDSFASDDYHLAPDREAEKQEKEARLREETQRRIEERLEQQKFAAQKQVAFEGIHDKDSAINYIVEYLKLPESAVRISKIVEKYCNEYNFSIDDVIDEMRRLSNGLQKDK